MSSNVPTHSNDVKVKYLVAGVEGHEQGVGHFVIEELEPWCMFAAWALAEALSC